MVLTEIDSADGARERIGRYAADRDAWRRTVATVLGGDERLDTLIEVGSLGRGGGDPFSDVDLIAVPADHAHASLGGDPAALLPPAGPILWRRTVRRNAPAGGAYLGVCYNMHGLPLWTDLYVWPAEHAAVPSDAAVISHRLGRPLPASPMGFIDLIDHTGTEPDDHRDGDVIGEALLRVLVAATYLARGDHRRLAHQLHALNLAGDDPPAAAAGLTSIVHGVAAEIAPETVDAISTWVGIAARLAADGLA